MANGERSSLLEVRFERTGGFAGVPLTLNIDSELLTTEQADKLCKLIVDSDFFNLSSMNMETAGIPDRFTYIITLEMEGLRHTVRTSEDHAPPQLKQLIDYLTGIARKLRSNRIIT